MSKLMNPLDLLRRSKTGAAIVAEIEKDDAAAERRKAAAKTAADANAKLAAANSAVRDAAANERKAIEAARTEFTNKVNAARQATAAARSKAFSLQHERDVAERHLRETADPRIDAFKSDTWQRFQSRRGNMASLSQEYPTGRKNGITGQPVYHWRTNAAALARWTESVTSAMSRAEALKLLALNDAEVEARLAALQAEVDAAEAACGELADAGPGIGAELSAAVQTAPVISRGPKQSRYQLVDAE